jgi:hypothetical protein
VEVVVQVKEETGVAVLAVRLSATKHPIFTGLLIQGSEIRLINNKQENLEVIAFAVETGKKPTKDRLKLQFATEAAGKLFQEAVSPLLTHDNIKSTAGDKAVAEK